MNASTWVEARTWVEECELFTLSDASNSASVSQLSFCLRFGNLAHVLLEVQKLYKVS